MTLAEIIFLAIALSIDAGVVSFSQGLIFNQNKLKNSLLLAFCVGFFQFLMPLLGWYATRGIYKYVETFDHWIVFTIFLALGAKFIYDAMQNDDKEKELVNCISFKCLILLSIATSIDALAAGSTLFLLKVEVIIPAIIIGVLTFVNSILGFWSGYLFKKFPSKWLEITAGVILIGLGVKVLAEHLKFI